MIPSVRCAEEESERSLNHTVTEAAAAAGTFGARVTLKRCSNIAPDQIARPLIDDAGS